MAEQPFAEDDGTLSPAERDAAGWVVRLQAPLSAAEKQALRAWLAQDADHARLLQEMSLTSDWLEALKFQPQEAPAERRPVRWGWGSWTAVAVVALAGLVGSWWTSGPDVAQGLALGETGTALGEVKRLELADGSVAWLNTETKLVVEFSAAERRLRLVQGEAHFQVTKNPARPFIVAVGASEVRAVGTAFAVRVGESEIAVLVTEGKVSVDPSVETKEATPILAAGQRATLAPTEREPVAITAVDERTLRSALAWQEGRIEFTDTPLSEVVREVNRYNRQKIVIADASLAAMRFGGAFPLTQREPLLELLEQSFGVVVEQRDDEVHLRRAP